ncbi:hypothetical protein BMS3Abin17_00596 [archaeon BMS3Abin17]|nr:hypothetical protein BMS3Abin17_00596 [archaeon BMS3Abin17]
MRDKKKWQSGKVKSGKVPHLKEKESKILKELSTRPEGLRVDSLEKFTDIPKRTIYRILKKLEKQKLVKNIFPIWKISNGQSDFCHSLLKDNNIFELHNMSYVVKLIKKPDWWSKRKNYLIRLKEWQFKEVNFGKNGSNPYQQIINENFVIQCYAESIIIIARKRYYSNNPYDTAVQALSDIYDLLDWFSERFRFKFWLDEIPHVEVRNNDFNRMNDAVANRVKKEKGKFLVEIDERRKVWVDLSEPFGKEANYPEGQERMEKITKDYLTKDVLLPSEIQQLVGKNAQHLNYHAENMRSHVEAIKELSLGVKKMSKEITRLNKIISKK